jgi:hypothetical protein
MSLSVSINLEMGDADECFRRLRLFSETIAKTLPPDEAYDIQQEIKRAEKLIELYSQTQPESA